MMTEVMAMELAGLILLRRDKRSSVRLVPACPGDSGGSFHFRTGSFRGDCLGKENLTKSFFQKSNYSCLNAEGIPAF